MSIKQDILRKLKNKPITNPQQIITAIRGYSPIPGIDFFTQKDKNEIIIAVANLFFQNTLPELLKLTVEQAARVAAKLVAPIKGIDYEDGKEGEVGPPGPQGEIGPSGPPGKNGSSDTAEQIRDKLQLLIGEARLDKSAIKGLEDLIKDYINRYTPKRVYEKRIKGGGAGGGGGTLEYVTVSGAVDGSNTSFTVPRTYTFFVLMRNGQVQRPTTDYTLSGTTITMVDTLLVGEVLYAFGQP